MNVLIDVEKKTLVDNMRKHCERVFSGWGGVKRFAEAVGVSPQSASRWLSGKLTPPQARLHAIAEVLGVDEEELCGRRKAEMAVDTPRDLPESVQGQIDAIDTQILLLMYDKQALMGKVDAKRHKECVRIIRKVLKMELNEE